MEKHGVKNVINRIARIRNQCRKATVISCHRCLTKTGVEKMNNIKIDSTVKKTCKFLLPQIFFPFLEKNPPNPKIRNNPHGHQ